jgi:RimJ/RimL family protein N-acetyltransferase
MIVAETHRLVLRWLQGNDLDTLASLFSHPEVMRHSVGGPLSLTQVRALIDRSRVSSEEIGMGQWAVFHKADKRLIGCCGLITQKVNGRSEIEISYRLDPRYWGKGFATEAAKACRERAFSLRVPRLICLISPGDLASSRVAEKLGMRHESDHVLLATPVRLYSLTKSAPATRSASDSLRI